MMTATGRQRDLVREIRHSLSRVDLDAPAALPAALPRLRALLRLDKALAYGIQASAHGSIISFGHVLGLSLPSEQFSFEFNRVVSGSKCWGFFNPARPERQQRNRVVAAPPTRRYDEVTGKASLARFGIDSSDAADAVREGLAPTTRFMARLRIEDDHQLRMLVCDPDGVLAWVGGYRADPFERAEHALFQRLASALQRRLALERRLDSAPLARAALDAALEALPRAAFVVAGGDRIACTNTLGRERLDREPVGLRRALMTAIRAVNSTDFSVTPLKLGAQGDLPWFLVIAAAQRGAESLLPAVRRRWDLTPRQSQVLGVLCEGASNKCIAARLEASERTVEIHLTAIMEKAGVESRAALIAAFWSQA